MNRRPAVNTLGKRIRWVRQLRGMDQRALANATGLTVPYLSQIETDKVNPRAAVIVKFSQVLRVSTDFLLLGKGARDVIENNEFEGELKAAALALGLRRGQSGRLYP